MCGRWRESMRRRRSDCCEPSGRVRNMLTFPDQIRSAVVDLQYHRLILTRYYDSYLQASTSCAIKSHCWIVSFCAFHHSTELTSNNTRMSADWTEESRTNVMMIIKLRFKVIFSRDSFQFQATFQLHMCELLKSRSEADSNTLGPLFYDILFLAIKSYPN